jgi:lysozyme
MEREGVRLTAYKDTVGVWTIGCGHTSGAGPPTVKGGMRITQAQAEAIFADDVAEFEQGVTDLIERPAEAHEFDAYVSLAYNIGLGAFAGSTTLKKFNAGDVAGAAEAILMWNIPHEIKARRRGEHQQFLNLQHVARA